MRQPESNNQPDHEPKPDKGKPMPEQELIPQSYEISPEVITAIRIDAENTDRVTNDVVRSILISYYKKKKVL